MKNKFNNLKVKQKLLVCFIIVTLLSSIAGVVGTICLITVDAKYSHALVVNGFSQGDIGEFNTYLNKGSAVIRDIIMLTEKEDIQASQTELEDIIAKTDAAFVKMKENCQSPEELEYISVIETKLPEYYKKKDQVIELGLQNKNEQALDMFHMQARPVLNEIMTAGQDLTDLNVSMGNEVSSSLTAQSRIITAIICILIVAMILISIYISLKIAKMFSDPINKVKEAAGKLAQGDLDIQIEITSEDEIGEMTDSFDKAITMMKEYIKEISYMLQEMAEGNFNISTSVAFKGDFKAIEEALGTILDSLNSALSQIDGGAKQVAIGATQMAENAQNLAEGATEQAGAVEELTATIENVTVSAENSAEKANNAYVQAKEFEREAEHSREEMSELEQAMKRINETSKEIEQIIGEIEDIASQTNLLSLNASIEAARAGEAGRGFAVVADQIGKLASDSAQSAINTKELINKSIEEISNGNNITARTAEALTKVTEGIRMLAATSKETSDLSGTQAETMRQIQQGVEQISGVVQSNSASAQETSATSEELSAQSQNLEALVGQFRLK